MSEIDELLAAGGGLDEDGALRLPSRLWELLADASRARVYAADRATLVGEIRLTPGGAGVYHDAENGFALLSPEEIEDLIRGTHLVL